MNLPADVRNELERMLGNSDLPEERRLRARIIVLYDDGRSTSEVGHAVGLSDSRTRFWRKAFERHGFDIFSDTFSSETRKGKRTRSASRTPMLSESDASRLRSMLGKSTSDKIEKRLRLLLTYADGGTTAEAAQAAGLSTARARYWRKAFQQHGFEIFNDGEVPGTPVNDGTTHMEEQQHKARSEKKPRTSGIVQTDAVSEAARKLMRTYFDDMLRNARHRQFGRDPEIVHKMRVATRRLRSVFVIFNDYFDARSTKGLRRSLRRLGKLLGNVRDRDVLLLDFSAHKDFVDEEERNALLPLIQRSLEERDRYFETLTTHISSAEHAAFLEAFEAFVNTELAGASPPPVNKAGIPLRISHVAPVLLMRLYGDVLAYEGLLHAATLTQLHDLRVHCKRLRYALEFLHEILGPESLTAINTLIAVQDHLGLIQDSQTAGAMITDMIDDIETGETELPLTERSNPAPLVRYLAHRHEQKFSLLAGISDLWETVAGREFRELFLRVLLMSKHAE